MGSYIISDTSTRKVAAGVNIKARDLIYFNEDGYAAPADAPVADLTGVVVGSSTENVDNTSGADGDAEVVIEHSRGRKAFLLTGSGIGDEDTGKTCYVGATPKTVTLTATNAITAGTVDGVEADGRVRVILPL